MSLQSPSLYENGSALELPFINFHLVHARMTSPPPDFVTTSDHEIADPASDLLHQFSEFLSSMFLEEMSELLSPPRPGCTFTPTHLPYRMEIPGIEALPRERHDVFRHCHQRKSASREPLQNQRMFQESLRRKRMYEWFSKLELLLPPEYMQKFDRCSVIEAAIRYIKAMEKTIAEASQSDDRHKFLQTPATELPNKGETSSFPNRRPIRWSAQELHDNQPSVTLSTRSEDTFVNVISFRRDPIIFSSLLSLLQEYKHEIVTATMSRTEEMTMYRIHAKMPSMYNQNSELLKGGIYKILTAAPPCQLDANVR